MIKTDRGVVALANVPMTQLVSTPARTDAILAALGTLWVARFRPTSTVAETTLSPQAVVDRAAWDLLVKNVLIAVKSNIGVVPLGSVKSTGSLVAYAYRCPDLRGSWLMKVPVVGS